MQKGIFSTTIRAVITAIIITMLPAEGIAGEETSAAGQIQAPPVTTDRPVAADDEPVVRQDNPGRTADLNRGGMEDRKDYYSDPAFSIYTRNAVGPDNRYLYPGRDGRGMGNGYPGYRGQGGSGYPQHRQYANPPRYPLTTHEDTAQQQSPSSAQDSQNPGVAKTAPAHQANRKALLHAAAFGDPAMVHALLKQGVDPDARAKDRTGRTALILAAAAGHVAIVEALLANGATVDDRDRTGHTALNWACLLYTSDAADDN